MFCDVRFVRPVLVNNQQRDPGDVAHLELMLATALIEQGYALPVGVEPLLELRPVRGRFH